MVRHMGHRTMKSIISKGTKTRALLLGGVLALGAGGTYAVAHAQGRPTPKDPASMAEFHGTVTQYGLNPRGDVDGLILADGTEVLFPPHMGREVQAVVHPGDAVTLRGERTGTVIRAGSVAASSGGAAVVDRGPPPGGPKPGPKDAQANAQPNGQAAAPANGPANAPPRQAMEASGVVKMQLHGPRGDVNGVLLTDGTLVRMPPKEAERLADALKPGQTVAVRGEGVAGPNGKVVGARAFGPSADKLTELAMPAPKPPGGPGGPAGAPGGPAGTQPQPAAPKAG